MGFWYTGEMSKRLTKSQVIKFQKKIFDYYTAQGRHHLPWRTKKRTPYQVLVSEVMLQQTQVDRVIPFFKNWMKVFPHWKSLAQASQADVLRAWKGLGYNSRALRLQKLAQVVMSEHGGKLLSNKALLQKLPGIGPYTAGAVRVFAFGLSDVFIETNIRRIFIHEFLSHKKNVTDTEIVELVTQTLPEKDVFIWYSALMDYGATLPKILKNNPNKKSKHYTKQSTFKGSDREIRGRVLDFLLHKNSQTYTSLLKKLQDEKIVCDDTRLHALLIQLEKEGFLKVRGKKVFLK